MSLKIRRGTDAERLTIIPAEGELIYTTDTQKVYVGDGATFGGNIVTGYEGSTGNGYTGSVGYTGSRGLGYTGSQGVIGYTGSAGNTQNYNNGYIEINQNNIISNQGTMTFANNFDVDNYSYEFKLKNIPPLLTTFETVLAAYSFNIRSTKNTDFTNGDILGVLNFPAEQPSTLTDTITAIAVQVDPAGTVDTDFVPTKFLFCNPGYDKTQDPNILTFDSHGRLGVNQENAQATLDVNGFMKLAILSSPPSSLYEGLIAIADGSGWDPLSNGKKSVVVYLDSAWRQMAVGA